MVAIVVATLEESEQLMADRTIVLPERLRLGEATALAADLKDCATSSSVTLDASKVSEMSCPGISLILSAQSSFKEGGGALKVSGAGDVFADCLLYTSPSPRDS